MVDALQCWRTALLKIPTRVYSSVYWRRFICTGALTSIHARQHIHSMSELKFLFSLQAAGGRATNKHEGSPTSLTDQIVSWTESWKDRKSARDSGHSKSQTITKDRHVFNHRYWCVSPLLQQWDWGFLPSGLHCTCLIDSESFNLALDQHLISAQGNSGEKLGRKLRMHSGSKRLNAEGTDPCEHTPAAVEDWSCCNQ